jgi:hypothetical protein
MQNLEEQAKNIRIFVRDSIHKHPEYRKLSWRELVGKLTEAALKAHIPDALGRAIHMDRVEQIVVQEATALGLNDKA